MECKIKNDLGLITINEDVMLKVAGYAALECYGIVAMSKKRAKDGFVECDGENYRFTSNGMFVSNYILSSVLDLGVSAK